MRQQLTAHPNLSFEVFNNAGERRLIKQASELTKGEFWSWLGVAAPK
jgi:hypothetical protein